MGSLLASLTSLLGGGGLGVIGGLIQKGIDLFAAKQQAAVDIENKKLDHQHELDMADRATENLKLEAQAKLEQSRVEGDTTKTVEDTKAMVAALASDKRAYATDADADKYPLLMVIVDFARGIIRPFLTTYLTAATSVIVAVASYHIYSAWAAGQLQAIEVKEVVQTALLGGVKTILFLTEMSVAFWFVTRPSANGRQ